MPALTKPHTDQRTRPPRPRPLPRAPPSLSASFAKRGCRGRPPPLIAANYPQSSARRPQLTGREMHRSGPGSHSRTIRPLQSRQGAYPRGPLTPRRRLRSFGRCAELAAKLLHFLPRTFVVSLISFDTPLRWLRPGTGMCSSSYQFSSPSEKATPADSPGGPPGSFAGGRPATAQSQSHPDWAGSRPTDIRGAAQLQCDGHGLAARCGAPPLRLLPPQM